MAVFKMYQDAPVSVLTLSPVPPARKYDATVGSRARILHQRRIFSSRQPGQAGPSSRWWQNCRRQFWEHGDECRVDARGIPRGIEGIVVNARRGVSAPNTACLVVATYDGARKLVGGILSVHKELVAGAIFSGVDSFDAQSEIARHLCGGRNTSVLVVTNAVAVSIKNAVAVAIACEGIWQIAAQSQVPSGMPEPSHTPHSSSTTHRKESRPRLRRNPMTAGFGLRPHPRGKSEHSMFRTSRQRW